MKKRRFTQEQMVTILRETDKAPVAEIPKTLRDRPTSRHARRSEMLTFSRTAATVSRLTCGLRAFPWRRPSTLPCRALLRPAVSSAGHSPPQDP